MAEATGKQRFGREVKIGLSVVGALLVTFSALLVWRVMYGASAPTDEPAAIMADNAPGGATLISPDAASLSGDASVAGSSAMNGSPAGAAADPTPSPIVTSAPIAATAYGQSDDPSATSGRRPPFARDQYADAGPVPAALDASPAGYDTPTPANPSSAAAMSAGNAGGATVAAGDPYTAGATAAAGDPNAAYVGAAVDGAATGQPYAAPIDPSSAALVQPVAGDSADAGAAPSPPYGAAPAYNPGAADNSVRADPAAPPRFVAQDGVRRAGHELRGADGRYREPGQRGPASGVASGYEPPSAAGEPGKYVAQPNDNYWTICEKVYGAGAFFKALQKFNASGDSPSSRLQVGDVVAVPPVSVLRRQFPDLCPKPRREQAASQMQPVSAGPRERMGATVYVVEQGDSLFDIARHQLGKASRWVEIYDLNRDALGDDFDYLRPGTELVMPGGDRQSQDAITRQRGESIQR